MADGCTCGGPLNQRVCGLSPFAQPATPGCAAGDFEPRHHPFRGGTLIDSIYGPNQGPVPDPAGSPRQQRGSRLHARASAGLRVAALALLSAGLAFVAGSSPLLAPWNALALSTGVAWAGLWRWGVGALAGAVLGLVLGLAALGWHWHMILAAALAVPVASSMARWALQRLGFDARLQRAADVSALAAVSVVLIAPTLAIAVLIWGKSGLPADQLGVTAFFTGVGVLGLSILNAGTAVLAFDRSVLRALHRGAPWLRTLAGGGAVLVMLGLLWWAAWPQSPVTALALLLPPFIVTVLALRGQLALAASGLAAANIVATGSASFGLSLWADGGSAVVGLLAWLASALALILAAHAFRAEWRSRSKRWEWALDGSQLGVADWHLQRKEQFASAAWRSLTGHGGTQWDPAAWQAQVHPQDQAKLKSAIAALTAGEDGRRTLELRLPSPVHPGGWRWAEATLLVIERDNLGAPVRLLATLDDVQTRHEALERQLMSVSLFQHLHEGLLITDDKLHALDVNPAYTQILGVPRDEVLGTVPSLLRPSPADPVARQQRAAMWASLSEHGSWRGELLERRRNGELCTLQATISTVRAPAQEGQAQAQAQGQHPHNLKYHVLVISDITEQRAQRERLERQAHFDELTRLPNRVRLSELLMDAMRSADRDGFLLVVCYLDLDRFKPVNDRFGHAAGDRLLAELAGRLRSALRSREHWADSAARLGGDEFVLLLRAGTLEEARLAVERVLRVVSLPYVVDPNADPVQVTASMGATVYPLDKSDADTLLRHADHAMYGAKQSGRNGYLFFDPEHRRRTEQRVMAIGRIQEALDQQEFILYYQPKVDMRTGRVLGFEALLRWEHPQQGLVAPMQFLPLIENTGLTSRVGDWVLSQALEHLSQWQRAGFDFSVSVNVSARHLQEPDFAQRLTELLARHSAPLAKRLEIEMLETAAHADIEATSALVARCQAIGVKFALDDFGTGYSTLTYLKRLPVDVLKIDRSFVHHMLDDTQDRAIVEGVIGLAGTFGCTVVAEGVESPAQARTLLELGCDIGQGTGIAAPMPSGQVANWVRDYKGMFALTPAAPTPPTAAPSAGGAAGPVSSAGGSGKTMLL
jgi:diguanylate cyclase (GGDEF)-like protein/PAS domain S-box-containing protein